LADLYTALDRTEQDRVAAAVGLTGTAHRVTSPHDPTW
jgi:hypothetical protein